MRVCGKLRLYASRGTTGTAAVSASLRCSKLAFPAQFGSPAALVFCPRTGGFASPLCNEFALVVCHNMHNVGFYYKVGFPRGDAGHPDACKTANYVTFLWLLTSLKTY